VRGVRSVFIVGPRSARGALAALARGTAAGAAALALALTAAGCGGGTRQDSAEASGTFQMSVVRASFPSKQAVARQTQLELQVKNTGSQTVPNVAVSLDSLNYVSTAPEVAANKRPIWAIERGPGAIAALPVDTQEVSQPGSGQTAYLNTWALGPLAAGHTQTFVWKVVPLKPGRHTVHVTIAAGLAGKAKAALASGGAVAQTLTVDIAGAPPISHVEPATGKVAPGAFPITP
jgi:hypothetical protein